MAAYRRVYDSRHLQADCQEPGSAPEGTLHSVIEYGLPLAFLLPVIGLCLYLLPGVIISMPRPGMCLSYEQTIVLQSHIQWPWARLQAVNRPTFTAGWRSVNQLSTATLSLVCQLDTSSPSVLCTCVVC